ncbi:amino acid/amide ABC transporter substrate-binding protein, HAAT family [Desulfonispora thiosulfatigenes DSM 11270]|uniref:Amino acid/amide ABC transporter substrate-binding protein, HAAT family n=1 Tax=Desulfonispora thiosulfatigenes DSM 11270 TaxID=656914 RepID=A0A1W1VN07_DESTI|nr:ABC transporter substrate-binding protein [Desulfonispora thiosulfatigenes]SMB94663.1 amino acid/amide ABC transporter substrate-binding protein, HAAT family [Desulfonispora thiosulfatigenes DSM 11270]
MLRKRSVFFVVSLLVLSLMAFGCSNTDQDAKTNEGAEDVIKIGVYEPLTGDNAAGGQMTYDGMKLANKLYPEILGKKVELVTVDNKSEQVEAANAVTKLIDNDKVSVILGSYSSGLAMAGGQVAKEKNVPVIGCSPTNPLVTRDNDYYFRVCFIDPFQGTVMAKYAFNELGAKKAAIIRENGGDYSIGLAKFFKDAFTELGGEIVSEIDYQKMDNDFNSQLTTVNKANPDVIFAPGDFGPSGLLVKQARQMDIKTPILGGDTWEAEEFIDVAGEAANGILFSSHFTADAPVTEMTKKFLAEYEKEYGKKANAFAALGFDTYIIALHAIEKANSTDPQAIRDILADVKDFEGSTGIISLDENGDALKSAIINQIENGKAVFKSVVEPK